MICSFNEHRLDDGSITKLYVEKAAARVFVINWREEEEVIVFNDVIGLEGYSLINSSLSHGTETTDDPLLNRSCALAEESPKDFRCFSFFSPWDEAPVLKIVARSFALNSP